MKIRQLTKNEIDLALTLAWEVFLKYESSDYGEIGTREFNKTIHDKDYIERLLIYGAFDKDEIIGVIATREEGNHIALFFVKESYHRQGVGRNLFNRIVEDNKTGIITVNSSPFAVPVYHRLGFEDTNIEQVENGIKYTPMMIKL